MSKRIFFSVILMIVLLGALLLRLPGERAQAGYSFSPETVYFEDPKGGDEDAAGKPLGSEAAVGNAFTYQGQLRQDGQAVNGACDFEFRLWDAANSGAQVGSTQTVDDLPVSGGLFGTSLDFGAGAFDGAARWLEVSVRCPAGSGNFTSLGRQALAPAPYALFAADAAALGGQPGSFYQARVGGACAVGDAIRKINADGTVECQPIPPDFTRTVVDGAGDVGWVPSIATGSDGLGLISYEDDTNGNLKAAHCNDMICSSANTYTLDSIGDVGSASSLAIGGDGLGLISYYDQTNSDLKVAHCNDTACSSASTYTLDSIGDVGGGSAVATGSDGLGLIGYYDATNGDLKVAHCNDAACSSASTYTLDSTGNVGAYTSIAIGSDGLGLISHYDVTNADLKVTHCNNVACSSANSFTLDSSGEVGPYSSLTIGGDGLGLISYYDITNGELKVAHCDNTICSSASSYWLESSANDSGWFTSITTGDDGLGLISYQDYTNGDLKVAHCDDASCSEASTHILDSAGNVGMTTSITIGSDGLGLVGYYDSTDGDLKVAHCDDVFCAP